MRETPVSETRTGLLKLLWLVLQKTSGGKIVLPGLEEVPPDWCLVQRRDILTGDYHIEAKNNMSHPDLNRDDAGRPRIITISFQTDRMMSAVIEGRKTETRRLGNGLKRLNASAHLRRQVEQVILDRDFKGNLVWRFYRKKRRPPFTFVAQIKFLFRKGDICWIKERHRIFDDSPTTVKVLYKADDVERIVPCIGIQRPKKFDLPAGKHVRPSRYMTKWAARHFIQITDVSCERLQAITPEQVRAEGVRIDDPKMDKTWRNKPQFAPHHYVSMTRGLTEDDLLRAEYASIWDNMHSTKPGCLWRDNPWVFRIQFVPVPRPAWFE